MLGGIARRCALGHPGAVVQCSNSAGQSLLRRLAGDVGARLGLARTFGGATAARSSSDGLNSFLDGTRFGPEDKAEKEPVGRAWETSELRLKSFEDLQGLWYVLLREKHMLSTEKYAARGARVRMRAPHRIKMIRRSMAKIKTVLTERIDEDAGDDTELRRKFMSVINAM